MADSISYTKPYVSHQELHSAPRSKPINTSKLIAKILCKSLFFVLFLIAIPLFPSQAPKFINQTILTKFWELVHLLFIGVAVSYGLFCRRNVEVDFETHSNIDDSQSSYVSRIFHASSIFEDGYENPYVSDEKIAYKTWSSQYYGDESMVTVTNGSSAINEQNKTGSLDSESGFEISFDHDENNVIQAWNSQYFQGESMVVVSQVNDALDECGKPGHVADYKPLGLPVRSLKSRIGNPDSSQLSNGSESGSSLKGSPSSSGGSITEREFGDMGPMNLEENFNQVVTLDSQVPWRSRSVRMERREKLGSVPSGPSHFRPLSVDETQFESLKSQSFRSTNSLSSQASSMSYSPTGPSPSHSISSGFNSEVEEMGEKKCYRASYPLASQSASTKMKSDAPLNAFHLRRYSSGSLFQKDVRGSLKAEVKDLCWKRREDLLHGKEKGKGTLNLEKKPATPVKASPRGKSVRTIRASGYLSEAVKAGDLSKNHVDTQDGNTCDEAKAVKNMGKNEMDSGRLDNLSSGTNNKNVVAQCHTPKTTLAKCQKREKEECSENITVKTEEDLKSKTDNFHVSSDGDAVADFVSDAGHDSNEVDKKAGEFIAKFREQIRLQKVASIQRSRAIRLRGNYIR